jgi:hypothetical protein
MKLKLMRNTASSMLCLVDDRGTIIGWIPFPATTDILGPGREKVYLARPTTASAATPRAA